MNMFYDDLLDLQSLDAELAVYLPDDGERQEILSILDATMHHVVMEAIFTNLPQEQHEIFLVLFRDVPEDSTHFDYLRQYQPDIEEVIRNAN
jgi:hypothetical protein